MEIEVCVLNLVEKKYEKSTGEKGYLLSPKDQLLGFDEIKKLKEIGIESIKGRRMYERP